jgi:alpha-methylacyl-CoA racemase
LIYARVTGWGQDGPLAATAGHDINYVAISGALHAMGDADRPPPVPLNLLGDYAGGGMFVALGILAALLERVQSGQGQVIDGAIIDGVGSLTAATLGMFATNRWGGRGENVLDGGAPWYRSYRTRDGGYVAVGAIEPQFFAALLAGAGLDPAIWRQGDPASWPALTAELARAFESRDRQYWVERFAGTDACVSPVLSFRETLDHPHHRARGTYTHVGGIAQPAPGPRMSRSKAALPTDPPARGADTDSIMSSLGRSRADIARLRAAGVIS